MGLQWTADDGPPGSRLRLRGDAAAAGRPWPDSSDRGQGKPAPIAASQRWVVERTNAWTNAHKKLVWCTERRAVVIAFWITFSAVIIIVGRLVRQAWTRYRWATRPPRRP
jgi:hypothetical protein